MPLSLRFLAATPLPSPHSRRALRFAHNSMSPLVSGADRKAGVLQLLLAVGAHAASTAAEARQDWSTHVLACVERLTRSVQGQ